MEQDRVTLIADGIRRIDLRFGGMPDVIAAYLIGDGDDLLLYETGPTTTIPAMAAGLSEAGVDFSQISRLMVSHIHLDHAGAAGVLMREHPHLRLSVHPVGAPHLAHPEKLIASAARIYTDQMDELWGEIAPVEEGRIDLLADGQRLTVSGHALQVRYVAGHASHHIVLFDEQSGVLFTGDTAGVRAPRNDHVGAATPPPEFDPEAWQTSVEIMRGFGASQLALTHAAAFGDVERHLDRVLPSIDVFIETARRTFASGGGLDAVIGALQGVVLTSVGGDRVAFDKLELADPAYVSAMGLQRYLKKRGELTP